MTPEKFNSITANCQPHKVFSCDWGHYYSDDFADSLLPDAGIVKGKHLRFYDGAEIVPLNGAFPQRFLYLSPNSTPLALTFFSFPKGVKAGEKWPMVQPDDNELCAFFETDINDRMKVCFRAGEVFKNYLHNHALQYGAKDLSAHIDSIVAETNIGEFQAFFKDEISHYKLLSFIGEMVGCDFIQQQKSSTFGVQLTGVRVFFSEPVGVEKKERRMFVRVDFTVSYSSFHYCIADILLRGVSVQSLTVLPNVVITDKKSAPQKISDIISHLRDVMWREPIPKSERVIPGNYFFYWDCTGVLDSIKDIDALSIVFETATSTDLPSQREEKDVKSFVTTIGYDKHINILDDNEEEQLVFGSEIIERQNKFISRIPKEVYDRLKRVHKLILHLPEIMVKLDWLHGALCQIHWLEGSGKSLKFPYEFFMSEERVKNIDKIKLEEYFRNIQYLSLEDLGYVAGNASNPNGENYFLYNEKQLDSVKDSLDLFHKNLIEIAEDRIVGGNEIFKKNINDEDTPPNENFFQSFRLGNEEGDLDDIGATLGRYDLRCYYQGYVHKDSQLNLCFLYTNSVKCRFFDIFSFADKYPVISQYLGCWKYDTLNPTKPVKFIPSNLQLNKWILLFNISFRNLKKSLHKNQILPSCADFFIDSPLKTIDDDFLAKIIRIY